MIDLELLERIEEVIKDMRGNLETGPTPKRDDETGEEYIARASTFDRTTRGLLRYAIKCHHVVLNTHFFHCYEDFDS